VKRRQSEVSPDAVTHYVVAREQEATHRNCSRGIRKDCLAPSPNEACWRCRRYLDASVALQRTLGLPPWAVSPLDVDGPTPPLYMQKNNLIAPTWAAAWEIRCLIESELARKRPKEPA